MAGVHVAPLVGGEIWVVDFAAAVEGDLEGMQWELRNFE